MRGFLVQEPELKACEELLKAKVKRNGMLWVRLARRAEKSGGSAFDGFFDALRADGVDVRTAEAIAPVSYTHLTLPTIYSV